MNCFNLDSNDNNKSISIQKKKLRKSIQERISNIENYRYENAKEQVKNKIITIPFWDKCKIILAYYAIKGEIDLSNFILFAIEKGKKVYLPLINDKIMEFKSWSPEESTLENKYGIPEPVAGCTWKPDEGPTMMLVPGLAFSGSHERLGRGKGYYDRYLQGLLNTPKDEFISLGLCFKEQVLPKIPLDIWDSQLDILLQF